LEDIVAFAELGQAIDRPLNTYSAGMYARLAFAVATQLQPDILIIDEILGAGDAYFAGKCMERMRALASTKGATVLFVSHDINAVQALCERVVWIKDGRLAMDGDPLAVARAYYKEVQEEHNRRLAECTHKTGAPYASSDTSVGHRGMPDAGMVVTPRIEAVRLVDADRQPVAGIQEGGELIVEVDYATPIALVHPMVGMSVYLLDGKPYCRALTNLDQTDLPRIQGRGTIQFVFRPFAAGAGEYVISVSLFKHINLQYHERSELYDSHDRAYRFRVWKPLGTVLDTGLVRMPYRIEHMAGGNLSRAVSR
jgi:hypothetical protein